MLENNLLYVFKKAFATCIHILAVLFTVACSDSNNNTSEPSDKTGKGLSSIFSTKNYSEFVIDSNEVKQFIGSDSLYKSIQSQIIPFYISRDFQFAWFSEGSLSPFATSFHSTVQTYMEDYGDSSVFDPVLDSLILEADEQGRKFTKNKSQTLEIELRLTSTFFLYAKHEFEGKIENPEKLKWFIPRKKKNLLSLLDSMLAETSFLKNIEPANEYYVGLKKSLRAYRQIEKSNKWPIKIPVAKPTLQVGESDSAMPAIKLALFLLGDFVEADSSQEFTTATKTALESFQSRMGIAANGKPDLVTLKELQVPINARIRQMIVNLERLRWLSDKVTGNFLLVNIPEFKLHVFEDGKPAWDCNVVVGKVAGRTQVFKGNLSMIVLNPSWGVPAGIVRNEVLPGIQKNVSYLRKHEMDVYEGNTKINARRVNWHKFKNRIPYTIRQRAGKNNPLGQFKFHLSNSYLIYLHDSNEPYLFNRNRRAFSHGCIRVEKARKLVEYLLRNEKVWTPARIDKFLKTKTDYGVPVNPHIPVYLVYLTSWVNEQGQVQFRKDLYGLDELLEKAFFE